MLHMLHMSCNCHASYLCMSQNTPRLINRFKAIVPPSSTLGKRRYQPEADPAFDAENLDPLLFAKKAKNGTGDFGKVAAQFVLKPTAAGPTLTPTARQTITPKRLAKKSADASANAKLISFSAPAVPVALAGRSPVRKRAGLLGQRRTSGSHTHPTFLLPVRNQGYRTHQCHKGVYSVSSRCKQCI